MFRAEVAFEESARLLRAEPPPGTRAPANRGQRFRHQLRFGDRLRALEQGTAARQKDGKRRGVIVGPPAIELVPTERFQRCVRKPQWFDSTRPQRDAGTGEKS